MNGFLPLTKIYMFGGRIRTKKLLLLLLLLLLLCIHVLHLWITVGENKKENHKPLTESKFSKWKNCFGQSTFTVEKNSRLKVYCRRR